VISFSIFIALSCQKRSANNYMLEEQVKCSIVGMMSETRTYCPFSFFIHFSLPHFSEIICEILSSFEIFTKRNHPSYISCFIDRFFLLLYFDQPFLSYQLYSSSVSHTAILSILDNASPHKISFEIWEQSKENASLLNND
jgi:hypothetical protein